jgi:hypothetical protein
MVNALNTSMAIILRPFFDSLTIQVFFSWTVHESCARTFAEILAAEKLIIAISMTKTRV